MTLSFYVRRLLLANTYLASSPFRLLRYCTHSIELSSLANTQYTVCSHSRGRGNDDPSIQLFRSIMGLPIIG